MRALPSSPYTAVPGPWVLELSAGDRPRVVCVDGIRAASKLHGIVLLHVSWPRRAVSDHITSHSFQPHQADRKVCETIN